MKNRGKNGYKTHNKLQLLFKGSDFFNCLHGLIDGAEQELYLQTYIFQDDETGRATADSHVESIRAAFRAAKIAIGGDSSRTIRVYGVGLANDAENSADGRFFVRTVPIECWYDDFA